MSAPAPRRFLRVALTGGIATGKSFCLRRFAYHGVPTIDADIVAREAVAPGTPGLAAVVDRFGAGVIAPGGVLDRAMLGRIVFADAEARQDLERIVHPAVYGAIESWFEREAAAARKPGHAGFAAADIPLLFETNQAHRFDRIIVAACAAEQQLQRLMARDGLSADDAKRRIDTQLPLSAKREQAHFVVDTSGTENDTARAVDRVWEQLR